MRDPSTGKEDNDTTLPEGGSIAISKHLSGCLHREAEAVFLEKYTRLLTHVLFFIHGGLFQKKSVASLCWTFTHSSPQIMNIGQNIVFLSKDVSQWSGIKPSLQIFLLKVLRRKLKKRAWGLKKFGVYIRKTVLIKSTGYLHLELWF